MAAHSVKGQGGRIRLLPRNFSVGYQSQLDESLETVADAQGQSVPLVQKFHHRLFDQLILKSSGKEFSGTIGLVSSGEAAGEHNDLSLADSLFKGPNRFTDTLRVQIAEYPGLYLCPGPLKGPGAVVLAVGSRKHRNEYRVHSDLMGANMNVGSLVNAVLQHRRFVGGSSHKTYGGGAVSLCLGAGLEHAFQSSRPGIQSFVLRD